MSQTLRKIFPTLRRQEDGIAAVEFGFAAIPFFLLLIGALELGHYTYAQAVIEGAAREAARQGITGYVPCGMTREEYIQAVIDRRMFSFTDPERRSISKQVYETFNNIGQPEPFEDANGNDVYDAGEVYEDINGNLQWDADMGAAGLGGPGDVVVYDISYELKSLTGFFAHRIGLTDGAINLSARAAVRNEPAEINPGAGGACAI